MGDALSLFHGAAVFMGSKVQPMLDRREATAAAVPLDRAAIEAAATTEQPIDAEGARQADAG